MNSIAPQLAEWVEMWRAAIPGFEVDSLWGGEPRRRPPGYVSVYQAEVEPRDKGREMAFRILGMPSPDGRYILDMNTLDYVKLDGDSIVVGGEPDSQCSLIDRRAKTVSILESCGTVCGFDWGRWLSPTRFAVGGSYSPGFGEGRYGTLSIYSLPDSTVCEYRTRIASQSDVGRYARAWRRWLLIVPSRHPARAADLGRRRAGES